MRLNHAIKDAACEITNPTNATVSAPIKKSANAPLGPAVNAFGAKLDTICGSCPETITLPSVTPNQPKMTKLIPIKAKRVAV